MSQPRHYFSQATDSDVVMDVNERIVNAVFEGGGVRGAALAGAAAAALDHGYRFEHVVGTSAGAMVASLISAG